MAGVEGAVGQGVSVTVEGSVAAMGFSAISGVSSAFSSEVSGSIAMPGFTNLTGDLGPSGILDSPYITSALSDESIAERVGILANELGMHDLAGRISGQEEVELNGRVLEQNKQQVDGVRSGTEDRIGQQKATEEQPPEDEVESEDPTDPTEETDEAQKPKVTDEEKEKRKNEEDDDEKMDKKDEQQRPQEIPIPRVAIDVDNQRLSSAIRATVEETEVATRERRQISLQSIKEKFMRIATESPIRRQVGIVMSEDKGIGEIGNRIGEQILTPTPTGVINAVKSAIGQYHAVVISTGGPEADPKSIQAAIGSNGINSTLRRNPF